MQDYDFFELTKLKFDPAEKSGKIVEAKINEAINNLETLHNDVSRTASDRKIDMDKINSLKREKGRIFTGGKINSDYDKLVEEKVAAVLDEARAIVNVRRQFKSIVTSRAIQILKKEVGLQNKKYDSVIEKFYKDAGYTIKVYKLTKPKFIDNVSLNGIKATIEDLQKKPDSLELKDAHLVTDMYSFVAYLEGEAHNSSVYRIMPRKEVYDILDKKSKEFANSAKKTDPLGKLCGQLAALGKTHVFSSSDTQDIYNNFLKYTGAEVSNLIDDMSKLGEQQLHDDTTANSFIKRLISIFGNEDDFALSIYNSISPLLKKNPYIPSEPSFLVVCPSGSCRCVNEFSDVEDAKRQRKCKKCSTPLYKPCEKCKKLVLATVLATAEKCPECGCVFGSDELFKRYFRNAEIAFENNDFDEAFNHLANAEYANPDRKREAEQLRRKITTEKGIHERPLSELRKLIMNNKYTAAAEKLRQLPDATKSKAKSEEKSIKNILAKAQSDFDVAKQLPNVDKVNRCYDILDYCVDFKPAIEVLRITPVSAPHGLKLTERIETSSSSASVTVSWGQSSERGVTYKVIRKLGANTPRDVNDGEKIWDDIGKSLIVDNEPLIGQHCGYAVCAKRSDQYGSTRIEVYSSLSTKSFLWRPNVYNTNHKQKGDSVQISWTTPKNCTGATVLRSDIRKPLAENNQGHFEDKGLMVGSTYEYVIIANYKGGLHSDGINHFVTMNEEVDAFNISASKSGVNTYRVTWDICNKSAIVQVLLNGVKANKGSSGMGGCDIILPKNGEYEVKVLASSGSDWVESINTLKINTYPLEVGVDWRLLPNTNLFAQTRKLSGTIYCIDSDRVMTKRIALRLCAHKDRFLPHYSEENEVASVSEEILTTPAESITFDMEINAKVNGESLKNWNLTLFGIDDDYKCVKIKQIK